MVRVFPTGDVRVAVNGRTWTYNPLSMTLAPGENPPEPPRKLRKFVWMLSLPYWVQFPTKLTCPKYYRIPNVNIQLSFQFYHFQQDFMCLLWFSLCVLSLFIAGPVLDSLFHGFSIWRITLATRACGVHIFWWKISFPLSVDTPVSSNGIFCIELALKPENLL